MHEWSSLLRISLFALRWIFDTELTGKIPDFIGNWTKLTALRLFGNTFEGPIPSTFSSLTSLTDLRLSDLPNGGSSLAFIKNMKSLSILVLRNNNISDSIPSDIAGYHNLTRLDLSFNSLHGPIPDSLFNMPLLSDLFLGSNKLTGALPSQLSDSLQNIDLSYNSLSGSFPSWVGKHNLQLNLVVNNFAAPRKSSTRSGLPSGFKCLQQNFPCNRGSGRYYKFSINCGGPQYKSSNNVLFERDNEALGAAAYYVTDTERWAVSNIGVFAENKNPQYTNYSSQQITNTSDPELFQSARLSPSSLRYYGLGLENGNYTVTLQFAELNFEPKSWKSHGRRVFDIYIQGKLKIKNFDIQKEASGFSYQAVPQKFKGVMVSENYLDIHLFWAGKGTCCVPGHGTYGPSISAISATPEFKPSVSDKPPTEGKNKTGLIVGLVVSGTLVVLLSAPLVFYLARRRRLTKDDNVLLGLDAKPYTFSYSELKTATGHFDSANKLGEGGFGLVYKGTLNDGRVVAVKQLAVASPQGKTQFLAEIATISAVQHRNLVKLYGCCIEEDNQLLVYEFLENKSLDQALFGKREGGLHLNWPTRFGICLGIARGLSYLHEESRLRIVHRDIKASNILLDSNLNPKISDFGLAKLYDDQKTHMSTRVAGTIGYLAPEYAMRGHLTEKTDVFAFGVVALEIVSGRLNFDPNVEEDKAYLLEWAWQLHENDCEVELVSSELVKFNEEEVKRVVRVALLCTQTSPMLRPPMSRVVAMLSGDIEVGIATSRPEYVTDLRFSDATSSMSSSIPTVKSDYQNLMGLSPENASRPVLGKIIREGR